MSTKFLKWHRPTQLGINDAASRLETNQKEQQKVSLRHTGGELDDVIAVWEQKLSQQAEELQEKHDIQLQEKEQEVAESEAKDAPVWVWKEEMNKENAWLGRKRGARQDTAKGITGQLKQNAASHGSLTQNETKLKLNLKSWRLT